MLHRTRDGQIIGSSRPRLQPIASMSQAQQQAYQQAQPHIQPHALLGQSSLGQLGQYTLEQSSKFPGTLFKVKDYDGAKALTALLLLLSTLYFAAGFMGFLVDHTPWLHDLLAKPIVVEPTAWWQVWKNVGRTVTHINSYIDISFRLFVFICTYCLAWATFDPRNIEGYIMGFFNTCLGLAYIFSPMDIVPDFVPVAGTLDDIVLGIGMVLLGVSAWYRNKVRDVKTSTVLELIDHGNTQKALQLLLEDKGIAVKDKV